MRRSIRCALILGSPILFRLPLTPSAATIESGCRNGLTPGDTLRLVGVLWSGRPSGELRVWVDSSDIIRWAAVWKSAGDTILWRGEVALTARAEPSRFLFQWRQGKSEGVTSVERVGDTAVTIQNGRRRADPVPKGIVAIPPFLPAATTMVLAQCALSRAEAGLPTVRWGTVRATKVLTLQLRAADKTKSAVLYAVSSDSTPDLGRIWLEDSGRILAIPVADWSGAAIQPEWTERHGDLQRAELGAAERRMAETARGLTQSSANGVAFTHVTLIDAERGVASPRMSVLVRGSRIAAIQPDSVFVRPRGIRVIDGTGKTLLPGLWNMMSGNANIAPWNGLTDRGTRGHLSRGVTGVFEVPGDTSYAPAVLARIAKGNQLAPRLVAACSLQAWIPDSLEGTGSWIWEHGQVRTGPDVERIVARCSRGGVKWIYLRRTFPPELLPAAVAAARAHGVRVSGQSLRGMSTRDLIESGYEAFAHVGDALYPFAGLDTTRSAWLLGRVGGMESHWATGPRLPQVDLKSREVQGVIALLVERRVPLVTALCVMPPVNRFTRAHDTTYDAASFAKVQEFTAQLHRAGAVLLAGTDNGCSLSRELALLGEVGLTNAELLRMATIDAARSVGLGHELGSITVGKRADLILVDGDPLIRIEDLDRVTAVMKDGILFTDLVRLRSALPFIGKPVAAKSN